MEKLVIFTCVLVVLVELTTGYTKCAWQKQDMKLAPTDGEWFHKTMKKQGFHFVENGDCNNCEGEEAFSWIKPKPKGRSLPKRVCYATDITTKYGRFDIPMDCYYTRVEDQICELDFSQTDVADKLRWGGTVKFVATDNSTYVAGTLCLLGRENLYWIMTTSPDKKLKDELYEEVMDHFVSLGFKRGTAALQGTSPYFWHFVHAGKDCGY